MYSIVFAIHVHFNMITITLILSESKHLASPARHWAKFTSFFQQLLECIVAFQGGTRAALESRLEDLVSFNVSLTHPTAFLPTPPILHSPPWINISPKLKKKKKVFCKHQLKTSAPGTTLPAIKFFSKELRLREMKSLTQNYRHLSQTGKSLKSLLFLCRI